MTLLNLTITKLMPWIPKSIIEKISKKYIAGEKLDDTITCIRELNKSGFCATINFMGEVVVENQQAIDNTNEYLKILNAINAQGLDANISIKPTALGLLLNESFCYENVESIVALAKKFGIFVRIDMEDAKCTQKEIELFRTIKAQYENVGLVLQSYLKRTDSDLTALLTEKTNVRLCKGVYKEDASILIDNANTDRRAINPHFLRHIQQAFEAKSYVAIATQDELIVQQAIEFIDKMRLTTTDFEFQMLLGVCEPLRNRLQQDGYKVRIFVPYGKDWYGYSMRRLKENPRVAGYVFKAIFAS